MSTVMGWLTQLFQRILIRIWSWLQPTPVAPGGPRDSQQPTDNLMRTMNLVMPLKNKTAIGRAQAAMVVGSALDEIYSGLDNVGTVHNAVADYLPHEPRYMRRVQVMATKDYARLAA